MMFCAYSSPAKRFLSLSETSATDCNVTFALKSRASREDLELEKRGEAKARREELRKLPQFRKALRY